MSGWCARVSYTLQELLLDPLQANAKLLRFAGVNVEAAAPPSEYLGLPLSLQATPACCWLPTTAR